MKSDAVGRLNRVGRAEYRRDHRDDVHQGHADDAQHVRPTGRDGLDDWRLRHLAVLALFIERGCLVNLLADDVAGNDDYEAEKERDAPAPGIERLVGHIGGKRQEDRRGHDLAGLHALQGEAGEEAAPAERSVLEDHRTGAGDFAGHREALYQPQMTSRIGARMPTC